MKKAALTDRCRGFASDLQTIRRRAFIVRNARRMDFDPPLEGKYTHVDRAGLLSFRRWGYSVLAVNLTTAWSDFVEDVFIGCVNRNPSKVGPEVGLALPKHIPYAVCEALFTTRGYLDFKSVGDLKGEGKKFLASNPFMAIAKADSDKLDDLSVLRNYVVHGSRRARKAYFEKVLQPDKYKNFVEPGTFLLHVAKGKTKLEIYTTAAESAAKAIEGAV
jgi:hypothetical protein